MSEGDFISFQIDTEAQQNKQKRKRKQSDDDGIILFDNVKKSPEKKIKENSDDMIVFSTEPVQDKQNVNQEQITPWYRKSNSQIKNPILRLHNEIIDFVNYIQPTEQEHELRRKSIENLKQLIQTEIPNCDLKPFGSYETKFYLPNADIDLVVVKEDLNSKTLFSKVAKILEKCSDQFEQIEQLKNAKVPIIKFVEKSSLINFDLSFNVIDGVKQISTVKRAIQIYPEIKYLLFIIKCILRQRQMHETFTGGVGSFLLFCMIVAFLREQRLDYEYQNKMDSLQDITLGEYLLRFFEFYGIKTDWQKKRIIMEEGGYLEDKKVRDGSFSLISPYNPDDDIGAKSRKIREIFGVFKNKFYFMTNYNFDPDESILKYIVNPSNQIFAFIKDEQ